MEGIFSDEYFMRAALKEAEKALAEEEVPVGAVVVCGNRIIGRGYNQTARLQDATAHAEMIAMTAAARAVNSRYLDECTLYVSIEPCVMCAGASFWFQLGRLVIGAGDNKRGFTNVGTQCLHPRTEVVTGILAGESAALMKDFFSRLRR